MNTMTIYNLLGIFIFLVQVDLSNDFNKGAISERNFLDLNYC